MNPVSNNLEHLTDRLTSTDAGAAPWLWKPLLTALAAGDPVTVEELVAATGRSTEQVRVGLAAMPDTEYDTEGRILGHGLTLVPTPHRFNVAGRTLYTWCALDTLMFPTILGARADVESPCHATGEPVRLTVDPTAVTTLTPAEAVVSLVDPADMTSVRSSFCNQVHFFASTEATQLWLSQHPDARVLPVAEAYELSRPLVENLTNQDGAAGNCCC